MDAIQLLQRRLEREKQARKAAEQFIENKALELYVAQQKREQAFQALQQQTEAANAANERLQQEIGRRVQAETLERLLEHIVQGHSLDAILVELAQIVDQHIPGGRCVITTHEGQQLFHADIPLHRASSPAERTASDESVPERNGRQIEVIEDFHHDPVWAPHCQSGVLQGTRHGWSVPLITPDGERLGHFAIHHAEAHAPSASDTEWVLMLAELAALAIGHRHLADNLTHQAHHDPLTDLPNRVLFRDRLDMALAQARREGLHVGVLFLDLDGFKRINDTLGHRYGDIVLLEVTRRIKTLLRETDTLARMGGDEFVIILPGLKDPQHAAPVAEKCLATLAEPMLLDGYELYVSGSIGISVYGDDAHDAEQLQRNADLAMYRTKARGKNGYAFFTPDLTATTHEWLDLRSELHHALKNDQFILHYQPQFHMDGKPIGVEALLRWQHPRLGMLSPAKFIPVAEECGLIVPITSWVLHEACRQMAVWRHIVGPELTVSVNVPAVQFEQREWVDTVSQILKRTGLPAHHLELELTETLLMQNLELATEHLAQLRNIGVRLAIDDFGTGYSSLKYLHQLTVDTLKIDHSFIHDIAQSGPDAYSPILNAIIDLGHRLGLRLIAEGVETQAQVELLRELGCHAMQGHLLAPAMPATVCEALLWRYAPAVSERALLTDGSFG